jgi:hypothetical protein
MDNPPKKQLTAASQRQDNILSRLKDVAKEKQHGTINAVIKIHDGYIVEIRPELFVGVIR